MNSILKKVAVLLACLVAFATPAAAASFGSGDGTAWGTDTARYSNGFTSQGQIRPYNSNHKLYMSGKVIHNWYSDENCGRYTANVTGTTSWTWNNGTCSHWPTVSSADDGKIKLCKDQWGWDPCGSWSSKIY